jgi:hypothetical protein
MRPGAKGKSFFDKNKNKINLYNGGTITRKYTILVLRQQKHISSRKATTLFQHLEAYHD